MKALVTRKDSSLQKLNCAINRKNYFNMGGNGEDSLVRAAGRVCISEGGQKHFRIYPTGGRFAGPMQVAKGVGQVGFSTLEFGWLPQCTQGMAAECNFHRF